MHRACCSPSLSHSPSLSPHGQLLPSPPSTQQPPPPLYAQENLDLETRLLLYLRKHVSHEEIPLFEFSVFDCGFEILEKIGVCGGVGDTTQHSDS